MSWDNRNFRVPPPSSERSRAELGVQEALRNIHISDDEDIMEITMQEREAAEVLIQMGGMSRGPQERKSVITDTRSVLQREGLSTSSVALQNSLIVSKSNSNHNFIPQHHYSISNSNSGSGGGIVFMQQPNQDPISFSSQAQNQKIGQQDSQVPISVVQRSETMSNTRGAQFSLLKPQQKLDRMSMGEPQLVQPLGSIAKFEQQLHTFAPLTLAETSSNKKQSSSGSINSQHPMIGQFMPQLSNPSIQRPSIMDGGVIRILSPNTGGLSSNHSGNAATSLLLPGGTLFHLSPPIPSSGHQISPTNANPTAALNIGTLLSGSALSQTAGGVTPSNTSLNIGRNLHVPSNSSLLQLSNLRPSPETLLRKKKEAKADKKALKARVPLNMNASNDIEVDGFIIAREHWAKAFVQSDICHAAGILFKALFTTEEIQKCTLRGRNGTSLLNLQKRSAIFRAVGWMKEKNQNPYSFDSSATLYHTHTLSHEEKMTIEKKVFVERRYQTSRKIRDHHHPKAKRNNNQNQKELSTFLLNPNSVVLLRYDNPPPKVEDIVVKPEPLDTDYYEGDYTVAAYQITQPPSTYIKKESSDNDQMMTTAKNFQSVDTTIECKPASPKNPKLDNIDK